MKGIDYSYYYEQEDSRPLPTPDGMFHNPIAHLGTTDERWWV